ncbi:MAG: protease HtpX [Candidatus Competibacteraceae bacterium]|uniref:Protease HtpX n=1 Tax=Candidatus Contendobacter odensis Run_B_J11 TaxID=1400861 RepID=A0A7U7GFB0_9GAMM|nr:protease HtpX [Candidatus Contendobacter odensis]MBK8537180.1 protease HtpX [Candidatus Competibacteraceae bacterium]MBK8754358.1 protease HtpX [Candidatus Competibacteraceae bacterium]CDH47247.1 Protease HtpX [Candidatus Contendobacter odensis Run_B_J11]
MKRTFLFLATNLAVVLLLGMIARLLGVDRFLHQSGLNLPSLLIFAAIFGMGGSLISLLMSKWIAKRSVGAQVIEQPQTQTERWLVETVRKQAQVAGIGMPEVALYQSPEPNAFATGANRNAALVAVSTGLLQQMTEDEVEAVLGHEVSHVANGDMVTLSLLQGVLNTFVIVLARVVGYVVDRALSSDNENRRPGIGFMLTSFVMEILFGFLASLVVMGFSRHREFHADAGGARLAGRGKMIAALERLRQLHEPSQLPSQMAAFGINGGLGKGLRKLLMTHPPLEERIAALRQQA